MNVVLLYCVVLICVVVNTVSAQYQGERCRIRGGGARRRGSCVPIRGCKFAIEQVQQNRRPQTCGFDGRNPIVCCPDSEEIVSLPPGAKSKQACEKYYGKQDDGEDTFRTQVVGGENSLAKEFPHMAALGYGEENDISWLCGGSLISELFVLTAAHCLFSLDYGNVQWVRLGDLNLRSADDDAQPQDFRVAKIHKHPDNSPPSQYNDIGLLQLDRPAEITPFVRPACLQTAYELPESRPIATGWGRVKFGGESSDHLMKVIIQYFSNEQCRKAYDNISKRRLSDGIVDQSQLCAGSVDEEKDTCQGDSGGPLQVRSGSNDELYFIVGITSFGKACGSPNVPGVYTRVSNYIPWIEQIVWLN